MKNSVKLVFRKSDGKELSSEAPELWRSVRDAGKPTAQQLPGKLIRINAPKKLLTLLSQRFPGVVNDDGAVASEMGAAGVAVAVVIALVIGAAVGYEVGHDAGKEAAETTDTGGTGGDDPGGDTSDGGGDEPEGGRDGGGGDTGGGDTGGGSGDD